jgi:hypothetical protein
LTPSFFGKLYSPIKKDKNIDIWTFALDEWLDDEATCHLMLQLGHLLHGVGDYLRYHQVRLISIVDEETQIPHDKKRLTRILEETRITGEVLSFSLTEKTVKTFSEGKCFQGEMKEIDRMTKYKTINAMIKKNSKYTSVLFLPLPPLPVSENEKNAEIYLSEIHALSDNFPPCLLVSANESVISVEF